MNILTIIGTRPEIIRLSRIMPKLDKLCNHTIVHTGQNYDKTLNDIFFDDLKLRKPDYIIDSKSETFGEQIGKIFVGIEKVIQQTKPNKCLILGDTNTSAAAFIAERCGIPVYHMEAGNRCWIKGRFKNSAAMPEEINRRMIDHISSFNLPYTLGSKQNLLQEGLHISKIFETGNPIYEVVNYYKFKINSSDILDRLNLLNNNTKPYYTNKAIPYCLLTLHRAECVDDDERLNSVAKALKEIANDMPVVFSCHPRTRNRLNKFGISLDHKNIKVLEPMGFFDFVNLEKNAKIGLTDSGTADEEFCILRIPSIIVRESTERPETKEAGASIVSGFDTEDILRCYGMMLNSGRDWKLPIGYDVENVSDKVVNFILGNQT